MNGHRDLIDAARNLLRAYYNCRPLAGPIAELRAAMPPGERPADAG